MTNYFLPLSEVYKIKRKSFHFPKPIFVHNRLTHSLEVFLLLDVLLGRLVGKQIIAKISHLQEVHGYQANDFGAIVAAAALSHDMEIHLSDIRGEKAVGEYFKTGNGLQYKDQLTEKQWQDLIDFEGNANGFRGVGIFEKESKTVCVFRMRLWVF